MSGEQRAIPIADIFMPDHDHKVAEDSDTNAGACALSDAGTSGPTTPRAKQGRDGGTDLDSLARREFDC